QTENSQNKRKKIKNTLTGKFPKTQETDVSSLFNFDTNHTKTPADMAGTRSQSKNHKKTPYETPSARGNNQKNEKKDKNKQNSSTASGSRDSSRDVDTAPNVNSNDTNKTQEETITSQDTNENEIDIPDADQADSYEWKTIELAQRYSLFINADHSKGDNLLEKKKYLENMLSSCHSLLGSNTKKAMTMFYTSKLTLEIMRTKSKPVGSLTTKKSHT